MSERAGTGDGAGRDERGPAARVVGQGAVVGYRAGAEPTGGAAVADVDRRATVDVCGSGIEVVPGQRERVAAEQNERHDRIRTVGAILHHPGEGGAGQASATNRDWGWIVVGIGTEHLRARTATE